MLQTSIRETVQGINTVITPKVTVNLSLDKLNIRRQEGGREGGRVSKMEENNVKEMKRERKREMW